MSGSCSSIDFFHEYYEVLISLWRYHNCSIYLLDLFMNVQRCTCLLKIILAARYLDSLTRSGCFNSSFMIFLRCSKVYDVLPTDYTCSTTSSQFQHTISTDMRQNYSSLKIYHNVLLADYTCYKTHEQLKHSKQL